MNKAEFEARLKEAYNGAVQPLNRFINPRATIVFKCHDCGLRFFAKPCHMVGKEHQRHVCNMPYGDSNGERLSVVGHRNKSKNKKGTITKDTGKRFSEMVWEDYTPNEIAKELGIPLAFVNDYFKAEGLI